MIRIDDGFLAQREFSGQVVMCFDQGALRHIQCQETIHRNDPLLAQKLLCYGIRIEPERIGSRIDIAG